MYARYIPPAKTQAPVPAPSPAHVRKEPSPPPAQAQPVQPAQVGGHGFAYSRYIPTSKPGKSTEGSGDATQQTSEPDSRKRKVSDAHREESPVPTKRARDTSRHVPVAEDGGSRETPDSATRNVLKKSKKSKLEDSNSDQTITTKADTSKVKKSNKDKSARSITEASEAVQNESIDPKTSVGSSAEKETDSTKKSKPKKKLKSAMHEEPVTDPTEDALDEKIAEAQRHKTVMENMARSLRLANKAAEGEDDDAMDIDPADVHDLKPLPQPEEPTMDDFKPEYETLPPWLARPIQVTSDQKTPFSDLNILPKAARFLNEKGFENAFAVQTAAIPLLLPTSKQQPGDLLISAATGSGKTLAYALPIVRDVSSSAVTRLRALVVLPTRELVRQAQDVFELCARAYEGGKRRRVRIGIAVGSQLLRKEQEQLVGKETRYDPKEYAKIMEKRSATDADEMIDPDSETDPRLGSWEGDVNDFISKVDVLICTPGRLVEHLEQTAGFSLDYVRWLVVDEADKLLAQSFQGWLEVVLEKFKVTKFGAREFPDMNYTGVRKVILSATLTRDLSLLNQLGLRRPQLITLDAGADLQLADHTLPALLREFAIRVHDVNLKPLYLVDLLLNGHMVPLRKGFGNLPAESFASGLDEDTSDTSSSSSDSDSDSTSDSGSDTSSDSSSDSEEEASPSKVRSDKVSGQQIPMSLIFTKSNESALRLSRLLALLKPSLAVHLATLTSTTATSARRKTLRAFTSPTSPIRLVIASDLVARGIDIPSLDHVINYDLPPSVAGYIHRVGRTARAGKSGSAWTLVGDEESGWFWGKIAKASGIKRTQKFERIRIDEMDEDKTAQYEEALAKLGKEANERRKK